MQFLNEKIKEKDSLWKKHKHFIFGMKGGSGALFDYITKM